MKIRTDITIDEKILKKFRKRCIDLGVTASKRIESLMIKDNKIVARRKK